MPAARSACLPAARPGPPADPSVERPVERPPSVHRRALFTWLAVYSAITVAQLVLGTSVAGLPLPVRTLILSAVVVPTVVYALVPALMRGYPALTRRIGGRD